jgi:hypothetical protein
VNGEPLVVTVARQGVTLNLGRTVVVVSPENAQPICQVLDMHNLIGEGGVDVVVQPAPAGPGDAFIRASSFLRDRAMILCADNVITDEDIRRCATSEGSLVVGTRIIPEEKEARRFTLIGPDDAVSEGASSGMAWEDGFYRAWLGPLVVDPSIMVGAIYNQRQAGERMIGANLGAYIMLASEGKHVHHPHLVEVDAYDIGSPDDAR